MKYIYVAGPMSKGDLIRHVRMSMRASDKIIAAGGAPYMPHLSVFHSLVTPRGYEEWMKLDFLWILRCDGLLRLPGESSGSDREVAFARENDKRVFFDLEECLQAIKEN